MQKDIARLSWGVAISVAILALSWVIPNHYLPWIAAYQEFLAALSVGVLGLALAWGAGRGGGLTSPVWFLTGMALIPLLQHAGGLVRFGGDALISAAYLSLAAVAVHWSSRCHLAHASWTTNLSWAFVAGAVVSLAIAAVQLVELRLGNLQLYVVDVPPGRAPFANLGQPNQLATLYALGIAGVFLLYERGVLSGAPSLTLAVALTFGLASTQSRTPFLFGLVALGWWLFFRRRVTMRLGLGPVAGLGALWLGLAATWPLVRAALGQSTVLTVESRLHVGPRAILWPQMIEGIGQRPWLGYGWNQVGDAQLQLAESMPSIQFSQSAHNLLMDLALWMGIPLAALFLVGGLVWLFRVVMRTTDVDGVFACLVLAFMLAHAMVEFPLSYLYFLVPFGYAVGILHASVSRPVTPAGSRGATGLSAASILIASLWLFADYLRVEEHFRDMRFAVARYGPAVDPTEPKLLATSFTQLAALHHFSLTTPREGMSAAEVEFMRDVATRYPYAPSLYRYALAAALNERSAQAQSTLIALRHMYPGPHFDEAIRELQELSVQHPQIRRVLTPDVLSGR